MADSLLAAADMWLPVRCARCSGVYDLGTVTVIGRYVDCSVWRTPCCDQTVDDRGETGWKSIKDYHPIDKATLPRPAPQPPNPPTPPPARRERPRPTGQAPAHPCRADWRCAYRDPATADPGDTEAPDLPLCRGCLERAATAVRALPYDYRDLEQMIPPSLGEWSDGQPRGGGEAPIPLNLGAEALQRDIFWTATTWAEIVAGEYQLSAQPTRCRDGYAILWAVQILATRLDKLARLGEQELADYPLADHDAAVRFGPVELAYVPGWQAVLDLTRLHDRARSQLGLTGLTKHLPGVCRAKGCRRPELYQDNGSDTVWCGHCGARMTRDDYELDSNLFGRERAA